MSKCGKVNYPSRKEAKQAMKFINRKKKKGDRLMMNQYYCGDCSAWHHTSMTQKKYDRIQKQKHE